MSRNISVLGAGAGGMSIAADLAQMGHRVTIYETPRFKANLELIRKKSGISLIRGDADARLVRLAGATSDPRRAVQDAELVIIAVPCFGHDVFARAFVPRVHRKQIVVFMGEGGGALVFHHARRVLKQARDVLIGETNTLPYSARATGPGTVHVRVKKKGGVVLAALPASRNDELFDAIQPLYPNIRSATNVLETILINFNAIDHVATVLSNAGRLESRTTDMLLWGEGATPSVARCIEAVDNEILAIRAALRFKDRTPYRHWLYEQGMLDRKRRTTHEAIQASALAASRYRCGPDALRTRYITEDVPYSLVCISSIARTAGVDVPLIDGLIAMASAMNGVDYRAEGRTLRSLGIHAKNRRDLLAAVA